MFPTRRPEINFPLICCRLQIPGLSLYSAVTYCVLFPDFYQDSEYWSIPPSMFLGPVDVADLTAPAGDGSASGVVKVTVTTANLLVLKTASVHGCRYECYKHRPAVTLYTHWPTSTDLNSWLGLFCEENAPPNEQQTSVWQGVDFISYVHSTPNTPHTAQPDSNWFILTSCINTYP